MSGPVGGVARRASASSIRPGMSAVASAVARQLGDRRARTARGRSPGASPGPSAARARGRRARASATRSGAPTPCALIPLVTPGPAVSARDARLARGLRPALGGERGRLLVAHVDDVDALLAAAVVDREEVAAREREQLRDPVRPEALGHEPPAVQRVALLGLGVGAHERREPTEAIGEWPAHGAR